MRYTTLEIVQKATVEMGLAEPSVAVSATDTTTKQLVALLAALGEELVKEHEWQALVTEHTFTTSASDDTYALPTDWDRPINQTHWSRTNHWPLMGPKSPQEWQMLKGGVMSSGPRTRFRIQQDEIVLHPVPTSAESVALEYVSSHWVIDGSTGDRKAQIEGDSDKHVFADRLLIDGLKLKFFEIKGLDTTVFRVNYERQLQQAMDQGNGTPVLNLARRGQASVLLSGSNVPDGSWA